MHMWYACNTPGLPAAMCLGCGCQSWGLCRCSRQRESAHPSSCYRMPCCAVVLMRRSGLRLLTAGQACGILTSVQCCLCCGATVQGKPRFELSPPQGPFGTAVRSVFFNLLRRVCLETLACFRMKDTQTDSDTSRLSGIVSCSHNQRL